MPRAKKKTQVVEPQSTVNEAVVARLCLDILDVYKNNCKNTIVSSNLTKQQKAELSKDMDTQLEIVKTKCFDQVSLIFRD